MGPEESDCPFVYKGPGLLLSDKIFFFFGGYCENVFTFVKRNMMCLGIAFTRIFFEG